MSKQNFYSVAQRFIAICLFMLCVTPMVHARRYGSSSGLGADENYHFAYISGTAGYSMLHTNISSALPQGNWGGAFGLGYEFRNSGLWASVGVQMSFHRSSLLLDKYDTRSEADQSPYRGFDTQGRATTFHYQVNQTDQMEWNFVDVPIMLGYYVRGFHLGAGVKVSYAINPKTRSYGTYELSATNDNYDVTFENMPDRGYTTYNFDATHPVHLNVGASLIGEIGYDLLSRAMMQGSVCHILKLSFYIEYGLNNFVREWDGSKQRVVPNPSDATKADIYPYLNTVANPTRTVPFYTGIKLTYLIGGNPSRGYSSRHQGCMCYQ